MIDSESLQVFFQVWAFDIIIWATLLLATVLFCDFVLAKFKKTLWRSAVWHSCWIGLLVLPLAGLATPKISTSLELGDSVSGNTRTSNTLNENRDSPVNEPIRQKGKDQFKSEDSTQAKEPLLLFTKPSIPAPHLFATTRTAIIVVSIYLCGLAWSLIRMAVGVFAIYRLRKTANPLTDNYWLANFSLACKRLNLDSTVQVGVSKDISMPMLVGVRNPMIMLPLSVSKSLTNQEAYAVLLHELAHVKRQDQIWNVLYKFSGALFWFHPLFWISKVRFSQVREIACDEFCIGALDCSQSYGETLLKIASTQLIPPMQAGIAFARDSKIGARLKFISNSEGNMFCSSSRLAKVIAFCSVGFLIVALSSISIHGAAYKLLSEPVYVFHDIEQKQVISNEDFFGMNCMDFSPDGEFLYASAWRTSTIHVFRVTGLDGELVPVQTFRHKHLRNNSSVRISPDGKWAASATGIGQTVLLLSRDDETGELSYADHLKATEETTGRRLFNDGVFSPDSKFLVVASMRSRSGNSGSLSLYEIDAEKGNLKWHQTEVATTETMIDPRSIAFSEDGNTIVSSAVGSNSLVVLNLDRDEKRLTIRQVLRNGEDNVRCLQKAFGSRFSPDGRFVYTTGGRTTTARRSDQAPMGVGVFQFDDRNQLRVVQQITDETVGCESLGGGNELEVSNDGKYVVTTLTDSSSVAIFSRDQATGQLDLVDVIQVPEDAKFSPAGLAIGNDSRTIIVSSEDSRKLYRFKINEAQLH